jgi:hypothetical protein
VTVAVGVIVGVAVCVAVAVGVNVGVGVKVGVGVEVAVGVLVEVGVNAGPRNCPGPQPDKATLTASKMQVNSKVKIRSFFPMIPSLFVAITTLAISKSTPVSPCQMIGLM